MCIRDRAYFARGADQYFWIDTPGHVDFAAEMERALLVMDYAIVVVSAAEGVQSHTEAIWELLARRGVPAFVFVNKIDRREADPEATLEQLRRQLSADIVDMRGSDGASMTQALIEAVAERDEAMFARLFDGGYDAAVWREALVSLIARRALFPVFFGAALTGEGVAQFLDAVCALTRADWDENAPFRARAFKIRHDAQGGRLCFFKVLSGRVRPRETLLLPGGDEYKIHELRRCQGARFSALEEACAGEVVCAPGLEGVRPGDVFGAQAEFAPPMRFEPMMTAAVLWDDKAIPAVKMLAALRCVEEEEPTLSIAWLESAGAIEVRVMGAIELEILRQVVLDRFGYAIEFGPARVLYQETIAEPAVGIGHYEPLRHYAEVHLRLVPLERGAGIAFASLCHVDELARNWQRLIETHVFERTHRGVLIGAPLTDVRIELLHGRAHLKHTEGGDFRQSTYRAIRNALMHARSVLLEPVCRFVIGAPEPFYGRVIGDLTAMHAAFDPPQVAAGRFRVEGEVAFADFADYPARFQAATRALGTLRYRFDRYAPCRDAQAVIARANYRPQADDTPDSVFCDHGAGFTVPWDQVRSYAHIRT